MNESLIITVLHNGSEMDFEAELQVFGYAHRFVVIVGGVDVIFEKDEEGLYRALLPYGAESKHLDASLLQAIARTIADVLA